MKSVIRRMGLNMWDLCVDIGGDIVVEDEILEVMAGSTHFISSLYLGQKGELKNHFTFQLPC